MVRHFLFLSLLLSLLGMCTASRIKLHVKLVEGGTAEDLADAEVQCWDEDFMDKDDRMTEPVFTDSEGMARLTYKKKKKSTWRKPNRGWDTFGKNSNPDIYCRIKKENVITAHTKTFKSHNQNAVANFGIVHVYPDRLARDDPGTHNGCGSASMGNVLQAMGDATTWMSVACNQHDLCYSSCKETKDNCEKEFKDVMYSLCHDRQDNYVLRKACKVKADAMYHGVSKMGDDAYKASRSLCDEGRNLRGSPEEVA